MHGTCSVQSSISLSPAHLCRNIYWVQVLPLWQLQKLYASNSFMVKWYGNGKTCFCERSLKLVPGKGHTHPMPTVLEGSGHLESWRTDRAGQGGGYLPLGTHQECRQKDASGDLPDSSWLFSAVFRKQEFIVSCIVGAASTGHFHKQQRRLITQL